MYSILELHMLQLVGLSVYKLPIYLIVAIGKFKHTLISLI